MPDQSEAYQILSDPDSRAFYDKVGKDAMNRPEEGNIDPQEIFSQIFGGGELAISTIVVLFGAAADDCHAEAFFDYVSLHHEDVS